MAKGQQRSNREQKKPKKDKAKTPAGGTAAASAAWGRVRRPMASAASPAAPAYKACLRVSIGGSSTSLIRHIAEVWDWRHAAAGNAHGNIW